MITMTLLKCRAFVFSRRDEFFFCETPASENSLPARECVWVGALAPAAGEAASRTLRVTMSAAASPCMSMANVGID